MTANPNTPNSPTFSDGERVIMLMIQCLAGNNQMARDSIDFIMDAIELKHYWALSLQYSVLPAWHSSDLQYKETFEILDMWWVIGRDYANLSQSDKASISSQFGANASLFPGFHSATESRHRDIASFAFNEMGKFQGLNSRDHLHPFEHPSPTLAKHRRALSVYKGIVKKRASSFSASPFSRAEIASVLSKW